MPNELPLPTWEEIPVEEFEEPIAPEIPTEALTAEPPPEATPEQTMTDLWAQIQEVAGQVSGIAGRVATEGITKAGEVLVEPTEVPEAPPAPPVDYTTQIATADAYSKFLEDWAKRQETLWGRIKGAIGVAPTETAEETIARIMPEVPARVTELDVEISREWTSYQQGLVGIERRMIGRPGVVMRGEQALLSRQHTIRRMGLLMERDALMGDYDRAMDRAKMVLGLEQQQRQEEREDQRLAIQFMMQTASAQEALYLAGFERQLDRQDTLEDREYKEAIAAQSEIKSVAASDPIAFGRYVAARGYPRTSEELLAGIGEFARPEAPTFVPGTEGQYQQVYNPATGQYEIRPTGIAGVGVGIGAVASWASFVKAGGNISSVPIDIRSQVVTQLFAPRDWTDTEFDTAFKAIEAQDGDYQEAINQIDIDQTIANKDRARELAAQYFKVEVPLYERPPEEAGRKAGEFVTGLPGRYIESVKKGYEFWRGVVGEIISPLYTE